MKTVIGTLAVLAALPACEAYYGRLPELASAELSCAESDLEVSDLFSTRTAARYTARCGNGKTYRCITMGKPYGEPETTCQPAGTDTEAGDTSESPSTGVARAPRGILPGGWPRMRIEACGAELTMPPAAQLVEGPEPTRQAGDSAFNFACTQLPAPITESSKAEEVVTGAVRGALEAIDGELIASRKLSGVSGRSLLIRVKGAQMVLRVWTQGQWLYSASVVPIDNLPDGAVAEYLDRIEVPTGAP
jgi:hypothetical protein